MPSARMEDEPAAQLRPSAAELAIFTAYSAFHIAQETLFWTRNNIVALLQGGLFATALSITTSEHASSRPDLVASLVLTLVIGGLVLALLWILMVRRSDYLFRNSLRILGTMEAASSDRKEFLAHSIFEMVARTKWDRRKAAPAGNAADPSVVPRELTSGFRLTTLWQLAGAAFAVAWIAIGWQLYGAGRVMVPEPKPVSRDGVSPGHAPAAAPAATASAMASTGVRAPTPDPWSLRPPAGSCRFADRDALALPDLPPRAD